MAKRMVLKEGHPTQQKLAKVFELMEQLKIRLNFYGTRTVVEDLGIQEGQSEFDLEDVESAECEYTPNCVPMATEWKLTYEKD